MTPPVLAHCAFTVLKIENLCAFRGRHSHSEPDLRSIRGFRGITRIERNRRVTVGH